MISRDVRRRRHVRLLRRADDQHLLGDHAPGAARNRRRPAGTPDDVSYRAQLDYAGDRYGVELERLVVGADFNPEVGFLRREDFARNLGVLRFSPPPRGRSRRSGAWSGRRASIRSRAAAGAGRLDTELLQGQFAIELENSESRPGRLRPQQRIRRPAVQPGGRAGSCRSAPAATVSRMSRWRTSWASSAASPAWSPPSTAASSAARRRRSVSAGGRACRAGRLEITPRVSLEPGMSLNWISIPAGEVK